MTLYTLLGLSAGTLGCLSLYLASPKQRLLASASAPRPARLLGAALLLLAWLAFAQDMQRLTASFVLITLTMLQLALLPYLGALQQLRRSTRA